MREDWQTVPLKDLCENFKSDIVDGPFGANLKREHYKESGIPVLKIQNIKPFEIVQKKMDYVDDTKAKELKRHNYKKGDIIITKLGLPLGISAIVEDIEDGVIVADLVRVRANKVNTKYLCYHLNSPVTNAFLNEQQGGSTRPRVRITAVRELPINVPPLPEQERIVSILDKAFKGIDQAIAHTEQNLASARELFESYLNNIFTQKGEDWVEKKLEEVTEAITKGSSPKWQGVEYIEDGGVLFVTSENVGKNRMLYNKVKFVQERFNEIEPKSILKKGDVLTNIVGASIGRTAIFDKDCVANINQAVCLIRCNGELLTNKFLSYLLNSQLFVKLLHENEIDNARANLSLTFFRNLHFLIPSIEEQVSLVGQIEQFHTHTQQLEALYTQKLNDLKELKQSLLQQAFAGELTKEDAA